MTHLLALVFLALCAVAILLATPHDDRGTALNVIVGTLVTLFLISWLWPFILVAGYWGWTTLTPWGVLGVTICSVGLVASYLGRQRKKRPTAASRPAPEKPQTKDERIDPMTRDGIMFRGKRLSTDEYKALPASEKARWQEEVSSTR